MHGNRLKFVIACVVVFAAAAAIAFFEGSDEKPAPRIKAFEQAAIPPMTYRHKRVSRPASESPSPSAGAEYTQPPPQVPVEEEPPPATTETTTPPEPPHEEERKPPEQR